MGGLKSSHSGKAVLTSATPLRCRSCTPSNNPVGETAALNRDKATDCRREIAAQYRGRRFSRGKTWLEGGGGALVRRSGRTITHRRRRRLTPAWGQEASPNRPQVPGSTYLPVFAASSGPTPPGAAQAALRTPPRPRPPPSWLRPCPAGPAHCPSGTRRRGLGRTPQPVVGLRATLTMAEGSGARSPGSKARAARSSPSATGKISPRVACSYGVPGAGGPEVCRDARRAFCRSPVQPAAADRRSPRRESQFSAAPARTRGRKSYFPQSTQQMNALKQDASKRKAELEAAMKKKIEFERKALHIVEQLLEENITEELLLECGKFITPAHYSDIVVERSIIKLCGYPLCQKKLGIVPKQKYKISTKTNKVYDITERKSFCSNFCYKASKYFEAQIPKSPVWVREEERNTDFQLLKEGQSGSSGEEVQLCSKSIETSDIDNPGHFEKQYESSSSSTCSDSTSDNEQDFVSSILPGNRQNATGARPQLHKKSILKNKAGQRVHSKPKDKEQTVEEVTEQLGSFRIDSQEKAPACELPLQKENTQSSSNSSVHEKLKVSGDSDNKYSTTEITLVGISKKSAEHFKRKFAKSNQVSRSASGSVQVCPEDQQTSLQAKTNLLKVLKETLIEWKTEETLRFLYGQNYASICSKPSSASLVNEELGKDDINFDLDSHSSALVGSQNSLNEALPYRGTKTACKPLPNYENLKKETEALCLRIREFYRGQYILNEETTISQDSEERDSTFPLIDSSSQNQIRKRIVLEKLGKVLPVLLGPLQITLGDIYTQLKNLVHTFRLTNRNIIHKPVEWTLIGMVLLSLLTPVLGIQKHSPKDVVFTQFIATLLEELQLKNEDLENLTIIFRTSC
ncbi:putative RNA polymerase II subunit B1 CTD phosphatase RPAP2 [Ctenodactylus gundi]